MSRISTRDPQTHAWPSLRSPGRGGPSHRQIIEARTRAARSDDVVVHALKPGESSSRNPIRTAEAKSADPSDSLDNAWIPVSGQNIADALRPLGNRLSLPSLNRWWRR